MQKCHNHHRDACMYTYIHTCIYTHAHAVWRQKSDTIGIEYINTCMHRYTDTHIHTHMQFGVEEVSQSASLLSVSSSKPLETDIFTKAPSSQAIIAANPEILAANPVMMAGNHTVLPPKNNAGLPPKNGMVTHGMMQQAATVDHRLAERAYSPNFGPRASPNMMPQQAPPLVEVTHVRPCL